jgi:hypothetical protein
MWQKATPHSLANRAKIRLSAEEWNTIKAVVEHGVAIPRDARKKSTFRVSLRLAKAIETTCKREK